MGFLGEWRGGVPARVAQRPPCPPPTPLAPRGCGQPVDRWSQQSGQHLGASALPATQAAASGRLAVGESGCWPLKLSSGRHPSSPCTSCSPRPQSPIAQSSVRTDAAEPCTPPAPRARLRPGGALAPLRWRRPAPGALSCGRARASEAVKLKLRYLWCGREPGVRGAVWRGRLPRACAPPTLAPHAAAGDVGTSVKRAVIHEGSVKLRVSGCVISRRISQRPRASTAH